MLRRRQKCLLRRVGTQGRGIQAPGCAAATTKTRHRLPALIHGRWLMIEGMVAGGRCFGWKHGRTERHLEYKRNETEAGALSPRSDKDDKLYPKEHH